MLVAAYIVSAILEVAGIALVVSDVRADRRRAQELMEKPRPGYVPPYPRRRQQTFEQVELQRTAEANAEAVSDLLSEMVDMLRGDIWRRLRGPGLVALGILVGTGANIAGAT